MQTVPFIIITILCFALGYMHGRNTRINRKYKALVKLSDENDERQRRIIASREYEIKQLEAEVKRLSGWQDATRKNVSYVSRFKKKKTQFENEFIINRATKIIHDIGVTFEGIGFIPFEQLEVFGK
jgi:lantibiotic modifying enzyme